MYILSGMLTSEELDTHVDNILLLLYILPWLQMQCLLSKH